MVPRPADPQAGAMSNPTDTELDPGQDPGPASGQAPPPPPPYGGAPDGGADRGPRPEHDPRDLSGLRRTRGDRRLTGVAGGLARHLDIDPLVVRVLLVVLVFFGGAGLLVYLGGWLLMPWDDGAPAVLSVDSRSRTVALAVVGVLGALVVLGDAWGGFGVPWPLAVVAIVVVVLVLQRSGPGRAGSPAAPPAPGQPATPWTGPVYGSWTPPPEPPRRRRTGPVLFWFTLALITLAEGFLGVVDLAGGGVTASAYPALALALSGVMLLVGSVWGRAGGLILVAVLSSLALLVTSVSSTWDSEDLRVAPASAELLEPAYTIDVGELVLDLTDVADRAALDGRTVALRGRVGQLTLVLPPRVGIDYRARTSWVGGITVMGREQGGTDSRASGVLEGTDDLALLTVSADLRVGAVDIRRAPYAGGNR